MTTKEFVKKIYSKRYGFLEIVVDEEHSNLLEGGVFVSKAGNHLYVLLKSKDRKKRYLHREIMDNPKGLVIDHINRNTLDNRKTNLRAVTIQENLRNQKRGNNVTGFTGVAVYGNGRFTAQIKHNYKKYHLGVFNTVQEALVARKKAESLLYV